MKKKHTFLEFLILILAISSLLFAINNYNTSKQKGYYNGKIEYIKQTNNITIMEVSPIPSKRYFISEIKANHQIKFSDSIGISGLKDPKRQNARKLGLGGLKNEIANLNVGDTIIFKDDNYQKNKYELEIDSLAVDLTLD
jgi:hypothetical protein